MIEMTQIPWKQPKKRTTLRLLRQPAVENWVSNRVNIRLSTLSAQQGSSLFANWWCLQGGAPIERMAFASSLRKASLPHQLQQTPTSMLDLTHCCVMYMKYENGTNGLIQHPTPKILERQTASRQITKCRIFMEDRHSGLMGKKVERVNAYQASNLKNLESAAP
jgi:hypothetical protein